MGQCPVSEIPPSWALLAFELAVAEMEMAVTQWSGVQNLLCYFSMDEPLRLFSPVHGIRYMDWRIRLALQLML